MLKINYLSKPILILSIFFLMFGCAKEEDEVKEEDTAKPTNVSIKINNDNSSTSSKTVNLQLYSKDNTGVTAYYLSQDYSGDSNASGWITISSTTTYNQTVSYTLNTDSCSSSTCLIYVYVWFKDAAGNTSSYNYDYIYYSPTAPTNPSISINGGDASTDNTSVTLSLSALDDVGVVGYFIADNGSTPSADASGWTTVTSTDNYSDNISYTLSGSAGSLKTINVWFKDVDGTLSSSDNDSIMYCGSGTTTMDEVEPNNSTSTAMDLCPTSLITGGYDGSSVEASGSHSDFFKVTATSNTMTVSLSHVSALASASDWDVVIYNSSGASVDSFDADDGVNNEIELWVTSGELYYIEVESQQWQTTHKYKLNTQFSTTSGSLEVATPNGTMATAMALTDNTTMRGERNGSSDSNDYYKITAPAGKTSMNVALSHDTASAAGSDNTIYVYKNIAEGNTPAVQSFSSNNGVDDNRTFGIVEGSEYYIQVDVNSSFGDSSSGYARYRYGLRASFGTEVYELEQNNSTTTAQSITAGTTYTGGYDGSSVEASGSHSDFFKVTATSNTMTVSLSHVSALASASDWDVVIYNSSGTSVDSFDADDGVNNEIELWVTSGQLYYIEVESQQWQTTHKYKLNTQFSTTSGSLEVATPNGTMATAMTLTDNTTMRGERNGSSDSNDYYKITAPAGKTSMNVALSHDNASAAGSDNTIYVYRNIAEGNTPAVQSFSSNNGVDDNRTFGIVEGSEYYIQVDVNSSFGDSSSGYARYRYGLRASFGTEVYELEQNNSTTTAQSITAGTTYTGGYDGSSVEASGSHSDFFKVTATSNTMTVALSHVTANASGSDWDVVVYNSSGTQVDSFDADNGVNASNNTSVTSGQLYYIEVESQQWQTTYKYTLRASF